MIKESTTSDDKSELTLEQLLYNSPSGPVGLFKPAAVGWRHVEAGLPPLVDQTSLYVEIMRAGFEIAQDDKAGLVVEVQSDFLLSGINVAINNVETGQIVEDERRDSSSKLVVGYLLPGRYEMIVYTHECVTNMDPEHGKAISSFDLRLQMSMRLLRLADQRGGSAYAAVPVEILDFSQSSGGNDAKPSHKQDDQAKPLVVSQAELVCLKEYMPLPASLEAFSITGSVDISETFYRPSYAFASQKILFTVRKGQDAIRVLLAQSNSKIAVYKESDRKLVAQSRPVEEAKAQLLIATELEVGTTYAIILEFSEVAGALDGEGAGSCDHFVMAIRTWDTKSACLKSTSSNVTAMTTTPGADAETVVVAVSQKLDQRDLRIAGTGRADMEITLDYSDSFYRAELSLRPKDASSERGQQGGGSEEEVEALSEAQQHIAPATVDFSKKQSTTYLFPNIYSGEYELKLRQRFKAKDCDSSVTVTIRSWTAAAAGLDRPGIQGQHLYQSQAEQQERPRTANKLPLNLNTYKFMGGESQRETGAAGGYLLFSGPVQLDELESQNQIAFSITKNPTLVRMYAENAGIVLTLLETNNDHAKKIAGGSSSHLLKSVKAGTYRVDLSLATAHARKTAEMLPPRTQLTIMVADPRVHASYNATWTSGSEGCEQGSNFPLALRQKKQDDDHQLYYDYPLVKVSAQAIHQSAVLQTYNFRVNVTSRMYFEVGMHMLSDQVTMQLAALGDKAFTIQGKQRGNLNVLDVEVGPGDYAVALKQPELMGSLFKERCGIFSLQGLLEPINLMSAAANSGDILQRGITGCPQATDGDILPTEIYGSKSKTKGGGELHVDAAGIFMRRFRNVLFKLSREYSAVAPEFDRMELEVVEDAWLHLSFLYGAYGANEVKPVLTDTYMLNQEAPAHAEYKVTGIANNQVEQVAQYRLSKGRKYTLTIYYMGAARQDAEGRTQCALYDLTMSISHQAHLEKLTRCAHIDSQLPKGEEIPSLVTALPGQIGDSDLDDKGTYTFEKLMKLRYPEDLAGLQGSAEHQDSRGGKALASLRSTVWINLSHNFDISASIDADFDEALFTMALAEVVEEEGQERRAEYSNLQSPLLFKSNNDHQKTVQRELHADDVESSGPGRKHALTFTNRQPDMLQLISPDQGSEGCLYINVKISIQAVQRAAKDLYAESTRRTAAAPALLAVRPADSPTFVHGRPLTVSFDLLFNTRPLLKDREPEHQSFDDLKEAIRLKASTVTLPDALKQDFLLKPVSISSSKKAYREDEFHIGVVFDISEYERSAREKLVSAQLFVAFPLLVDHENRALEIERSLKADGLPIYVFEQNDEEQLLKEEGNSVKAVLEGTALGQEIQHQLSTDMQAERSELERQLEQVMPHEVTTEIVKCLCVHGLHDTCHEGEAECQGGCKAGYTGPYCDIPTSEEVLTHVNQQHNKKEINAGGLYSPVKISEQVLTGKEGRSSGSQSTETSSSHSTSGLRAQRIEGELSSYSGGSNSAGSYGVSHTEQSGPYTQPLAQLNGENTAQAGDTQAVTNGQFLLLIVLVVAFFYTLVQSGVEIPHPCPRRDQQQRRYRALSELDRDQDSDADDVEDDPAARRRTMELSSFGPGRSGQGGASSANPSAGNATGAAASQLVDAESGSASYQNSGGFPMTSFTRPPAGNFNAARPQGAGAQGNQRSQGLGHDADVDDAAEQLEKELELFAQEEDEESALMITDYAAQPQNSQQDLYGHQRQQDGGAGQDDAELAAYENYFDQNQ